MSSGGAAGVGWGGQDLFLKHIPLLPRRWKDTRNTFGEGDRPGTEGGGEHCCNAATSWCPLEPKSSQLLFQSPKPAYHICSQWIKRFCSFPVNFLAKVNKSGLRERSFAETKKKRCCRDQALPGTSFSRWKLSSSDAPGQCTHLLG